MGGANAKMAAKSGRRKAEPEAPEKAPDSAEKAMKGVFDVKVPTPQKKRSGSDKETPASTPVTKSTKAGMKGTPTTAATKK